MYFSKPILALAASFAFTATALPTQANDAVEAEPSLWIAPGFIPDPEATEPVTHHQLQSRFDKPFQGAHQMQFLCEGGSLGEGSSEYLSKESDCNTALTKLAEMNGHWDCTHWTDGRNLRYYVIFEYGTCKAYASADIDQLISIGNGDVFAWINGALNFKQKKNGETYVRAQGKSPCKVGGGVSFSVSSG